MSGAIDLSVVGLGFPGMGVHPCGAEPDFYARHREIMQPFLRRAAALSGYDLERIVATGDPAGVGQRAQQVFAYAFSAAMYQVLEQRGVRPSVMAGYSFGIYAALFAARVLTFDDALAAAGTAFDLARDACAGREAGMAVILGLSEDEVDRLVRCDGCGVELVNSNNATCKIFAGPRDRLRVLTGAAQYQGAIKAELFDIDIAYHHAGFLGPAAPRFAEFLGTLTWSEPRCPIVSSIDQHALTDAAGLRDFTARNLHTPIRWDGVMRTLGARGITAIIECGPGISLAQNARFGDTGIPFVTVKTIRRTLGI